MSLTVRPATAADIPAIAAIYRPAVLTGTASFEVDPPDGWAEHRDRSAPVRHRDVLASGGERSVMVLGNARVAGLAGARNTGVRWSSATALRRGLRGGLDAGDDRGREPRVSRMAGDAGEGEGDGARGIHPATARNATGFHVRSPSSEERSGRGAPAL